ncbi:hypothetical protein [Luteimonas vadosa]|uniref:DUF4237 domain-containing protein n=1 Tax=Luteimonas vadosa TaxID=1165507 RepID=A0ABP9DVM5_9GAMM
MSGRWQHKMLEVKAKLFGGKPTGHVQAVPGKQGAEGWQLVPPVHPSSMDPIRLNFKKES